MSLIRTNTLELWRFTLGPFETNCYVVAPVDAGGGGECWIIDASFGPKPMIEHVRANGLRPTHLILTHAHCDHIAGVSDVRRAFPGIRVLLHEAERDWLGSPMLNLSAAMGAPVIADPPDALLAGGEELELGPTRWRVLHTPGHSPGGITLHEEREGIALVGDTLFQGSIGRFDFPTSDADALLASIKSVLYRLPGETRVYPGHGPETTVAREVRSNPFVRPETKSLGLD